MSDPYIGEIRTVGFAFAPAGWVLCDGQLLQISDNVNLFDLIGTTYGGDGTTTFAVPDFRGRFPVHMGTIPASGTSYQIGDVGGVESVTLTTQQLPVHSHQLIGSTATAHEESPVGHVAAQAQSNIYGSLPPLESMASGSITPVGGGNSHENMHPFISVNFIMSLAGVYPA